MHLLALFLDFTPLLLVYPQIDNITVLEELRQRLQERSGFGSYGEIQQWLAQDYDVQAAYATVHGIVRYKRSVKTQTASSNEH